MPWQSEVIQIPFEGVWLPGYFLQPAATGARPRKTVIALTGFDGTAEELYFQTGQAALGRGWNVLIAEGPGQTGFLRFHPNVAFRPDYERPVGDMTTMYCRGVRSIHSGLQFMASAMAGILRLGLPHMIIGSRP